MSDAYGGRYEIVAKADRSAHATDRDEKGVAHAVCHDRPRLGKTVVGEVDGYQGIVDAEDTYPGITMCGECVRIAREIQADHDAHRAQVVAEGAAAGRKIRYTLHYEVIEDVPETATLFSIKDARERFEHEVRYGRLFGVAEDLPEGVTIDVEFADEEK